MKQCRACGMIYSDNLRRCPRCRSFSRNDNVSLFTLIRHNIFFVIILLIVIILLWIASIS